MTNEAEILREIREMRRTLDRIAEPVLRVTTRKESRAEQAKRMKCSIRTLLRREQRERRRLMLEGRA